MSTRALHIRGPAAGERARQLAFGGAALACAVVAGAAPALAPAGMPQAVAAAALLLGVVMARLSSRAAGLAALWALWLLAPGIRRLVGLTGPYLLTDPLALVPFVATAVVAAMELARVTLAPSVRRLLALAVAGYLIGVPFGMLIAPLAAAYALLAYGAALLAFVLGAADGGRSLTRSLLAVVPVLSAYGIYQYFAGVPAWDEKWLDTVDFITAGGPEEDRVRVFATLNSPGTFAAVLGITMCAYLALRAVTPWRLLAAGTVIMAFALTYVRSAWVSLMAAALVYVVVTRGRGAGRVAFAAIASVLLVLALGAMAPSTGDAITSRFESLGSPQDDRSANERVDLRLALVPQAAAAPLGHGLGQAGEATRLGENTGLGASDNGYLALLYQVGAVGFLLVAAVVAAFAIPLFRGVWRDGGRDPTGAFLVTALAFFLVMHSAGDVFWGITGVMFWYLLGCAHRWTRAHESASPEPNWRRRELVTR